MKSQQNRIELVTRPAACQYIIGQSAHYLLAASKAFYKPDLNMIWFDLDDYRETHDSLPVQTVIQVRH